MAELEDRELAELFSDHSAELPANEHHAAVVRLERDVTMMSKNGWPRAKPGS